MKTKNNGTLTIVEMDVEDIEEHGSWGSLHVACITIKRKDGKTTRVHLSIAERNGRISAHLNHPIRSTGEDKKRKLALHFEDWETPRE